MSADTSSGRNMFKPFRGCVSLRLPEGFSCAAHKSKGVNRRQKKKKGREKQKREKRGKREEKARKDKKKEKEERKRQNKKRRKKERKREEKKGKKEENRCGQKPPQKKDRFFAADQKYNIKTESSIKNFCLSKNYQSYAGAKQKQQKNDPF